MKLNRFLFITVSTLCVATLQSQTIQKKNQLEFSVGSNSGFLKNLEFAPVVMYKYESPVYKLGYTHISKNQNIFQVKLDYLKTELKTDVLSNLNNDYFKVGVSVAYLKQLYNKNGLAIHLGLQSQSNTSIYSNENPYYNVGDYFTFHQEFGITSRFSYQLNEKQYLSSKLSLPVALFRATSAEGKFHSLGKYQSVLWDFEYGYKLSDHIDIKATYNFNYARLQVPSTYRELQHQLNLGINYKF
ncbi:hypothetical protein [Flavobacterium sp. '19STA2R22 D10 B1']|uniref:hypothetical protein n=1 Tax=Flavobacterium aerium TaxID=3037261 RepID=UPI00278C460E|nr:hypothetical protein [Flavobacterium sp. '19STA2R22 D10 B1']